MSGRVGRSRTVCVATGSRRDGVRWRHSVLFPGDSRRELTVAQRYNDEATIL